MFCDILWGIGMGTKSPYRAFREDGGWGFFLPAGTGLENHSLKRCKTWVSCLGLSSIQKCLESENLDEVLILYDDALGTDSSFSSPLKVWYLGWTSAYYWPLRVIITRRITAVSMDVWQIPRNISLAKKKSRNQEKSMSKCPSSASLGFMVISTSHWASFIV